jgi:hypothetical protein
MSNTDKSLRATFYMKGGHAIEVGNIKSVELTRDADGSYKGYTIEWADTSKSPGLFSMSIPDIVAVMVQDDQYD